MAEIILSKKYDALQGRPVRDIKSNDIFHIATSGTQVAAGNIIATGTTDAYSELYITGFGATTLTGGDAVYVVAGNSTLLPTYFTVGVSTITSPIQIITTLDAPLFKVPVSTTVSIKALGAGTYSAWLSAVRQPKFASVETA